MTANDPFARVKAQVPRGGGAGPPAGEPPKARQITPVPHDAPAPPAHPKLGKPSALWPYRDAGGELLGYVARFDRPAGKEIRPLTWRDGGKGPAWAWVGFDDPRPLYGLPALTARPGDRVLIVEGEKAADAAAERFPALVVMTWPGGAKAVGKGDWSPLAGREVAIWPDADQAGQEAARAIAKHAKAAGAAHASIVALPEGLPAGWDLADDWPPGFGQAEAEAAIKEAFAARFPRHAEPEPPAAAEPDASGVTWPPGFRMDPYGLWQDQADKPTWLSDPFEVIGEARNAQGLGWSVVVRFKARDGREATLILPRAGLASGGGDARTMLADAGLTFNNGQGLRERFANALCRVSKPGFVTLTAATGWLDGRFVLPERTIGPAGSEPVMFTGDAKALKYAQAGSFERWRSEVAAKASGNPSLMFALAAGFAAPLLRLLDVEGGGFHFTGNSSSGKSTLLMAAGSIWGGDPNGGQYGFGHPWRATTGALEGLAMAHNDGLLCLDEFGEVEPGEAGSAAYMLANGEGKNRLRSDITLRSSAKWVLLFLSSGEVGLAGHVAAGRKPGQAAPRVAAGQELRLLDIAAEAGRGLGIWECLAEGETAARRSEALKAAAKAHYGHAGPIFLERLLAKRDGLLQDARDTMSAFLAEALKPTDSGQIARAAKRFAVIAAAGELAAGLGVVPWELGDATKAIRAVFDRWARDFGRTGLREERQVIRLIRGFIETNRARFGAVGEAVDEDAPTESERKGEARAMVTAGFVQMREGEKFYNFITTVFAEVLEGYAPAQAARFLKEAGYLETDKDRFTKKVKRGGTPGNYYSVSARIIEHGDD